MLATPDLPHIPVSVQLPVLTLASLIPAGGFLVAAFGGRASGHAHPLRLGGTLALGLAAWGGLVVGLATRGLLWGDEPHSLTPLWLVLAWILPGLVAVVGLERAPGLRAALASRSGLWRLASLEVGRNIGGVFFILHGTGDLPGPFTHQAAWGDIAVGVTAPIAAAAAWYRYSEIRRSGSPWRRAFIAWNVLGALDHVISMGLAMAYMPGAFHLLGDDPNTATFAVLPLSMFPTFMVPFASGLHFVMLTLLLRPAVSSGAPEEYKARRQPELSRDGRR